MRHLTVTTAVVALAALHVWGCSAEEQPSTDSTTSNQTTSTSAAGGAVGTGGAGGAGGAGGGVSASLTTPELPTTPGDHAVEVGWEDSERTVIIRLPKSYDPQAAHPLMLVLHGGTGNAPDYRQKKDSLANDADAAGVVIVFPEGTSTKGTNQLVWNSWGKPSTQADDVGFLEALTSWLVDGLSLDGTRVFVTGFSNGAAMTQRFVAERPDLVAGAVAVGHSSGMIEPDPATTANLCGSCAEVCDDKCAQVNEGLRYDIPTPKKPVNLFVIRGGADTKICPAGGCSVKGKIVDPVETQADFWLTANGCQLDQLVQKEELGATFRRFEACADGKVFQHAFDPALGHVWSQKFDAPVLDFLLAL